MFQNLVVSPLFLECFAKINKTQFRKIMLGLETERFLCDGSKQLLKEYDLIKEKNKGAKFEDFIEEFIKDLTIGRVNINSLIKTGKRERKDWENYQIEKLLAETDNWKIILTNEFGEDIKSIFDSEYNIELADVNDYQNPSDKSRLRVVQRISKTKGDEFDFWKWIEKYLMDTCSVEIKDPYACENREFKDVKFILSKLKKNTKVKIVFLSDKVRKSKDNINAEDRFQDLRERNKHLKIELDTVEDIAQLKDRELQTDKFIIDLGHSLGATYKDKHTNKVMCKRQFAINVTVISNR